MARSIKRIQAFFNNARLGNKDNCVKLDSKGLSLKGNAKCRRRVRIPASATGKGAAAPTTVYAGCFVGYRFGINDTVYYTSEIVQRWDGITDIEVLLNWCIDEVYITNNGKVQWQLDWCAVPSDGSESIDAPTHSGTLVSGDLNIGTVLYSNIKTLFTTNIPAAGLGQYDLLGLKLTRIALDDGANPTAKPVALQAEMIVTLDKLGQKIA